MQKRKYTQPKAVAGLTLSMREEGMTSQKIAYELGLILKQMKNWLFRHNCEKRNLFKGIAPKPAQFASTDCPFRMSGVGSSVEAVWVLG